MEYNTTTITPELQEQIEKAREEYRNGESAHCSDIEELHKFLDSL